MMYRYILGYYYNCPRAGLGLSNAGVMLGLLSPLLYFYPSTNAFPFLILHLSISRDLLNQLVILQCVHLDCQLTWKTSISKADLKFQDPTMTPHIHPLTHRHHDLNTHESLSFNLDTDLDTLLQGSGEESEVGRVVAVLQLDSRVRGG
jgi:hypothetical protein